MAVDFPVPIFISETGCNTAPPRTFADMAAIFGPEMVGDWSGAIVYEWIWEQNHYALIGYNPENPTNPAPVLTATNVLDSFYRKGTPTPRQPDFSNLQEKWRTNTPAGIASSDYNPSAVSTRACPTSTAGGWWEVDGDVPLPTLGET